MSDSFIHFLPVFLSVIQTIVIPPDLVLPLRPCRVANSSPHRASSGFAPYRSAPCWAHSEKAKTGTPIFALGFYSARYPAPAALTLKLSLDFHRLHCLINVASGSHNACQAAEGQCSSVVHARANRRIVAGSEIISGRGTANVQPFNRLVILI